MNIGAASFRFVVATGNPALDSLLSQYKWGDAPPSGTSLSFSFPDILTTSTYAPFYGSSNGREWTAGWYTLSEQQRGAFRTVISEVARVADIAFVETADNQMGAGDIRIAVSNALSSNNSISAYAYYPGGTPAAGDIWLDTGYFLGTNILPGSWEFSTLLHEMGHALGLSHPFEEDAIFGPGLSADLDNMFYTVMSYTEDPTGNGYSNDRDPTTLMLLDIQALQHLYGANEYFNTGDDTYSYLDTGEYLETLWDAAGFDTIDYSASTTAATIDLRPGSSSSLGKPVEFTSLGKLAHTDDRTVWIAYGAEIEAALGSQAEDSIQGNDLDNVLDGQTGDDTLKGGSGDDALYGGPGDDQVNGDSGNDTLDGGPGFDTAFFEGTSEDYLMGRLPDGSVNLADRQGTRDGIDVLNGIELLSFTNRDHLLTGGNNSAPIGELSIEGSLNPGQRLLATHTLADADGLGRISYQWQRDGSAILGATDSSYDLSDDDVGSTVSVLASYIDGAGSLETVTASATVPVSTHRANGQVIFEISRLTTSGSPPDYSSYARLYFEANVPDEEAYLDFRPGATGWELFFTTATQEWEEAELPLYELIDAVIDRVHTDGTPATASEFIARLSAGDVFNLGNRSPQGGLFIVGTLTVGNELTASPEFSDADGLGELSYQWYRDGIPVTEATDSSYTLAPDDVGAQLSVFARYKDGLGTPEGVHSAATEAITGSASGSPLTVLLEPLVIQDTQDDDVFLLEYSGSITAQSALPGETLSYRIEGGQTDTGFSSLDTEYGRLILNSVSGEFSFSPNNPAIQGLAESLNQFFAIEISGATTNEVQQLTVALRGVDDTPAVLATPSDQVGPRNETWSFTLPENLFQERDSRQTLSPQAVLSSGQPLPDWLAFDGSTFTISPNRSWLGIYEIDVLAGEDASHPRVTFALELNDAVVPAPEALFNTAGATVAITGAMNPGAILNASKTLTTLIDSDSVQYHWQRNGEAIEAATEPFYEYSSADTGTVLSVVLSYHGLSGETMTVTSARGGSDDDRIEIQPGDFIVDGGGGADAIDLPMLVTEFNIVQDGAHLIGSFDEYFLELHNVEYASFGSAFETTVPIADLASGLAQDRVEKLSDLYLAFFGRAPDVNGLEYWQEQILEKGRSFADISKDFAFSSEAQVLYPADSGNREFVRNAYLNAFDREPDVGGWDYWTDRLDALGETDLNERGVFVGELILGAYAPTSGDRDRDLLTNRHEVSLYYANKLTLQPDEGYDHAISDLLARLTVEPSTLDAAQTVIDLAFSEPVTLTGLMSDSVFIDSLFT